MDLVPQERNSMNALIIVLLLLAIIALLWLSVRELQRHEIARKNMSFMESLQLSGLPIICFTNNGQAVNMIFDTGSNLCILDKKILETLEYQPNEEVIDTVTGVGGAMEEGHSATVVLAYKDQLFECECHVTDISQALNTIKQEYGVTAHGILGTDFFTKYKQPSH